MFRFTQYNAKTFYVLLHRQYRNRLDYNISNRFDYFRISEPTLNIWIKTIILKVDYIIKNAASMVLFFVFYRKVHVIFVAA